MPIVLGKNGFRPPLQIQRIKARGREFSSGIKVRSNYTLVEEQKGAK
ncbi:MAG TPA: hypothetical protein VID27_09855 [Blastocatellia bacterium]